MSKAAAPEIERLDLFGGDKPWSPVDWTDSDDRVRGGSSQSYLEANSFEPIAHFHGTLDYETLGGAGFASQRTTTEKQVWDLHEWEGICLDIVAEKSDSKKYTLILKDALLPLDPSTEREQATISWEYDFTTTSSTSPSPSTTSEKPSTTSTTTSQIHIPFTNLNPTYRGKPHPTAAPLLTAHIRRFSLMNRSFFGTQSGGFSLYIRSISAYRKKRSRLQTFLQSRAGPPVVLGLGTMVLFRGLMWGVDSVLGPR